ncbi:YfeK family protein [Serratia sp. L9]|uniref:YfeK family protein n=1 Tax=Serratia sp. L9 TaxID=3423946 RepID=UPI003D66C362
MLLRKMMGLLLGLLITLPAFAKLNAHEEARIAAMLNALGQKQGLIFVRNGDDHTSAEAVEHLKLKLGNTRKRLNTAEQFIDKVASVSSISGKPYYVKIAGQPDVSAKIYLNQLIKETDKTLPAVQ